MSNEAKKKSKCQGDSSICTCRICKVFNRLYNMSDILDALSSRVAEHLDEYYGDIGYIEQLTDELTVVYDKFKKYIQ